MGRPPKDWAELGLPPLRQYWQQINRQDRQAQTEQRTKQKACDKKRAKCRCDAYRWPHRPGGGLCRHPDPPEVSWRDAQAAEIAAEVAKFKELWGEPTAEQLAELTKFVTRRHRPYRKRYAGILRQIARNNGLHPIRDRALIQSLMPRVLVQAKQIKRQQPRVKYRNVEIIEATKQRTVVRGVWTTAGPTM